MNLFQLIDLYANHVSSKVLSETESYIIKYYLPKYGYTQAGRRRTREEYLAAVEILKTIQETCLNELLYFVEEFVLNLDPVPKNLRRIRQLISDFIEWRGYSKYKKIIKKDRNSRSEEISSPILNLGNPLFQTDGGVVCTTRKRIGNFPRPEIESLPVILEFKKKFTDYWSSPTKVGRKDKKLAPRSIEQHLESFMRMLRWYANDMGVPDSKVSPSLIFPERKTTRDFLDNQEDDVHHVSEIIDAYTSFMYQERGVTSNTVYNSLSWLSAVIKFFYSRFSKDSSKRYWDIAMLVRSREVLNDLVSVARKEKMQTDRVVEYADYNDLLRAVEYLESRAKPYASDGDKRSPVSVAKSYQRYAVLLLITFIPRRQRVIQELELGRTIRKIDDEWHITLWEEGDYKLFDVYGAQTIRIMPEIVQEVINKWITVYRPVFEPKHNFLFVKVKTPKIKGKPIDESGIYSIVTKSVKRVSGRWCSPHYIRDIVITAAKERGCTDRELESLAWMMGHSRKMQDEVYDKRRIEEKPEPAITALGRISKM